MTIKELNAALEEGQSLKTIAQAYSEIADLKIKRIRAEVERNRAFFQELSWVYGLIKGFAAKKKISLVKPKDTVSLVLTSNYRFYGRINLDLLEFFEAGISKFQSDKIYLGKAAIDYFRARGERAKEVLLKSDQPDGLELQELARQLSQYNRVLVFYSSMKSLLNQVPTVNDIAAPIHLGDKPEVSPNFKFLSRSEIVPRFIFEPELPKILEFFDNQIITLLLEGTFLESELSRTASRFISMDTAETQANKFIRQYQILKAYAKRNMDNNTILENFATMMAVRRTQ